MSDAPKKTKQRFAWRELLAFYQGEFSRLFVSLAATLGAAIMVLLIPLVVGFLVDRVLLDNASELPTFIDVYKRQLQEDKQKDDGEYTGQKLGQTLSDVGSGAQRRCGTFRCNPITPRAGQTDAGQSADNGATCLAEFSRDGIPHTVRKPVKETGVFKPAGDRACQRVDDDQGEDAGDDRQKRCDKSSFI